MKEQKVKTSYQLEKEARENAIFNERQKLLQEEGAMKTAVDEILMKKHNIHSRATIWSACKKAGERIKKQEEKV